MLLKNTSVLYTGAYWDSRFPRWLPLDRKIPKKLLFIADVACDVKGSIECLHRTTTIEEPFFYVDSSKDGVPEVKGKMDETDLKYKMIMGVCLKWIVIKTTTYYKTKIGGHSPIRAAKRS